MRGAAHFALLPEADDDSTARAAFADTNLKLNEFLHRRVEIEDVVGAHLLAIERAAAIGHGCYIISATTPFLPADAAALRRDPAAVLRERLPQYAAEYARRGWRMADSLDRVYYNRLAREQLGWQPRWDFAALIAKLARNEDWRSPLALAVGRKLRITMRRLPGRARIRLAPVLRQRAPDSLLASTHVEPCPRHRR